jgi:hypothetical protein
MSAATKAESWVVYARTVKKEEGVRNVVCEQGEWDEMERAKPGAHPLIKEGIASEAEAERLARGTSGDALKGGSRKHRR